ncbi:cytochrome P450 7B1 isoform X2 [Ambystoma mexicanum]|uniref:cytochrome P450 7B1 isoform X2 n=1 Tax=Ambystoma mexicanum TaxID=8296 RepID=UPI0037E70583
MLHALQCLLDVYTLALGAAVLLLCWWLRSGRRRRVGEPPLESGWIPYLGLALQYRKDPLHFLQSLQKKHGDIFTVKILGKYMTFIMDPCQYQHVTKHGKQLDFSEFASDMASRTFDYPRLTEAAFPQLNDSMHKAYKILQGDGLSELTSSMMGNLQHVFKRKFSQAADWRKEKLYEFCCSVMFEASFMTLYGTNPAADGQKDISEIRDKFSKFDAKFPYLFTSIPIVLLGATKKTREALIHTFFPDKMSRRLGVSDLVQYRSSVLDKYEQLLDYDKAAHHFAFMWASVGNTIPATFWALYYLAKHPEALAVVRDEIDHLLKSTGQTRGPEYKIHMSKEQLDSLVYLGSAIHESFRMCTASMNIRVVQEDFVLKLEGEQRAALRKGDFVALFPQTLHNDPEVYSDPEVYKFDRFVENGAEKNTFYKKGKKLKYYLMPFGSGVSMCPGRFFAVNEIKQFLALMVTYFDLELTENKTVGLDKSRSGLGILLPDSDIAFRCKPRS